MGEQLHLHGFEVLLLSHDVLVSVSDLSSDEPGKGLLDGDVLSNEEVSCFLAKTPKVL